MNGRLEIQPTSADLVRKATECIASLLLESVKSRKLAMIALSGGTTPRSVYMLLGSEPMCSMIPWANVHLFWGDERCVPPDNAESNFRMVKEALLDKIAIPSTNIHRTKAEQNPAIAAQEYEEEIKQTFQLKGDALPRFDVILLGLGEDGHTASLFPGTTALQEQHKLVTEVYVEKLKAYRISMTLPLINNARHLLFLVSGKGKAGMLAEVLQSNDVKYPAQLVKPVSGDIRWLVDRNAASHLEAVNQP